MLGLATCALAHPHARPRDRPRAVQKKSAHSRPLCSANGEKARVLICP